MTLPKAMSLTEEAAKRATALIAKSPKPVLGLRVGVENGGCSGLTYKIEYAEERLPHEEVVEDKGVRIFIEPKALMYLLGSVMDYRENKFESGFVFDNPNETGRCGCGESFSVGDMKPGSGHE